MMKKTVILVLIAMAAIMLSSCGNTLFNAGGVYVTEIHAINLPNDGDFALAGAWFPSAWTNTNDTMTASGGEITWTFATPIKVAVGNGDFKIVQSGTWLMAIEGGLHDPYGNANVFNFDGIFLDDGNWVLTWDASKTLDDGMTASK